MIVDCPSVLHDARNAESEFGNWNRTAAIQAMHEGKDGDYHKRILDTIVETARATHEILGPEP